MCGKESRLVVGLIEGVEMQLCGGCATYGQIVRKVVPIKKKSRPVKKEILQLIIPDYDKIVRQSREKLKLSQKEFAERLQEKESIIHKLENKEFKPSIALAQKLEKILRIKLVETVEVEKEKHSPKIEGKGLTIGDLIKLK